MMTEFTPLSSLVGGLLIGLAAVWLMAANGRIAGVSGILGRLLPPDRDGTAPERVAFIVGLIVAPMLLVLSGGTLQQTLSGNLPLLVVAGLLVGFGSTVGSGCTSGHGVCGLSRLSKRALAATLVFMVAGMITVYVARHMA
jgi:uncharacterized membrane protein YedE/YeeE